VLLQLTTEANVVPSHTVPVPCVAPKPEPEIVYWPAGPPAVADTLVIEGSGFKVTAEEALLVVSATLVAVTVTVC
jgi:hypothetical protein